MKADAYILAGGRSTRFGSPKPFAVLNGETLALRSARIARESLPGRQVTFVIAEEDQFSGLELPGRTIADGWKGHGAWSGLAAALNDAAAGHILVLACDLPLVSAAFVRMLADGLETGHAFAAARQADGRIQPLCSFIDVGKGREAVARYMSADEKLPPVAALFEREDAVLLEFDDYRHLSGAERLLNNVNTAADLAAAEIMA